MSGEHRVRLLALLVVHLRQGFACHPQESAGYCRTDSWVPPPSWYTPVINAFEPYPVNDFIWKIPSKFPPPDDDFYVGISSNGNVQWLNEWQDGSGTHDNVDLPSHDAPEWMVAVMWTHLVIDDPSTQYVKYDWFGTPTSPILVVEWKMRAVLGSGGIANFQLQGYHDGLNRIVYRTTAGLGNVATCGYNVDNGGGFSVGQANMSDNYYVDLHEGGFIGAGDATSIPWYEPTINLAYFHYNDYECVAIGFPFPYMGGIASHAAIMTNGNVQLGCISNNTEGDSHTLYDYAIPGMIAPFWTSLAIQKQEVNYIRYETIGALPNRRFVVEWKVFGNRGDYNPDDVVNFQLQLWENGGIWMKYKNTSALHGGDDVGDGGAVSGICTWEIDGKPANQFSDHQPALVNGLNLLFTPEDLGCSSPNAGYCTSTTETPPQWENPSVDVFSLRSGQYMDDRMWFVPLKFNFTYFNVVYNKVGVSSNGIIQFLEIAWEHAGSTNEYLPLTDTDAPKKMIAVLWTNLGIEYPSTQYIKYDTVGAAPNRRFVVEWKVEVYESGLEQTINFQLQLYETSNKVLMLFDTLLGMGNHATCGMTSHDGTPVFVSYQDDMVVKDDQTIELDPVCGDYCPTPLGPGVITTYWVSPTINLGYNYDDESKCIDIPFEFPYMGVRARHASIVTNGNVQLGHKRCKEADTEFSNVDLNSHNSQRITSMIAPYWDDLGIQKQGVNYIRYQTIGDPPDRRFVVEWRVFKNSDNYYDPEDTVNFQLQLWEDGIIWMLYKNTTNLQHGSGATCGISSWPLVNQYSYHEDVLMPEVNVLFYPSSSPTLTFPTATPTPTGEYEFSSSMARGWPRSCVQVIHPPRAETPGKEWDNCQISTPYCPPSWIFFGPPKKQLKTTK